jgi:hypothetical protein
MHGLFIDLALVGTGKRGLYYCQGNTVRPADSWPNVTVPAHGGLPQIDWIT